MSVFKTYETKPSNLYKCAGKELLIDELSNHLDNIHQQEKNEKKTLKS